MLARLAAPEDDMPVELSLKRVGAEVLVALMGNRLEQKTIEATGLNKFKVSIS
jgi:hypothetical protein